MERRLSVAPPVAGEACRLDSMCSEVRSWNEEHAISSHMAESGDWAAAPRTAAAETHGERFTLSLAEPSVAYHRSATSSNRPANASQPKTGCGGRGASVSVAPRNSCRGVTRRSRAACSSYSGSIRTYGIIGRPETPPRKISRQKRFQPLRERLSAMRDGTCTPSRSSSARNTRCEYTSNNVLRHCSCRPVTSGAAQLSSTFSGTRTRSGGSMGCSTTAATLGAPKRLKSAQIAVGESRALPETLSTLSMRGLFRAGMGPNAATL
mmetsp:Transcript_33372/g.108020  ORF Transcript_33372/g.108020 Transcript_33372/m.108020 type:complete len:265 (-) Transcript_33372:112-906(-)